MMLSFRPMTTQDIEAVFDVRAATAENALTPDQLRELYGITPSSVALAMASAARGWICADSGQVVGYVMGDGDTGEVEVLAVLPHYEGRGIGTGLMALVQDWLFANGHDTLFLLTNPDPDTRSYGFYRKLGWRPAGETVGEDERLILEGRPGSPAQPAGSEC
jgi:ribosomal protein S18 acetylase RimI-like enzyme